MKTTELTGAALDWAVAIAEGFKPSQLYISKYPHSSASIYTRTFDDDGNPEGYITGPSRLYSQKWEAGGPIIEREGISVTGTDFQWWECDSGWYAHIGDCYAHADTPLTAAMRCYVASKLGDDVEVPKELIKC